ncbi:MAG: histidine kinase [Treponema sp.]|nr:histidine kinase [Treponema sp.]
MPSLSSGIPGGIEVYVRLVWLFVLLITILLFILCFVYLAMRRALEREQMGLAFSHLATLGLETERRRISRELHDTVLPLVKDPAVSDLIRAICMDLAPPDFTRLALKDSLSDLCDKFSKRSGIECAFSMEDTLDFSPLGDENQLHLYRMVQEALTNIEKHSRAQRASLVARSFSRGSGKSILICVSDDGAGIQNASGFFNGRAKNAFPVDGFGIRSMRQRAVILGARLDFKSESSNGLMVRIEIPLPAALQEGIGRPDA